MKPDKPTMRAFVLLLTLLPLTSIAQEKFYVQGRATFLNEDGIREKVRDECGLEGAVGEKVFGQVQRLVPTAINILDQDPPTDGSSLTLAVLTVSGNAGSGWTGSKSLSVKADYRIGEHIVASEVFTASSRGGFWGGFKGICSILDRDTLVISKSVTNWVKSVRSQPPEQLLARTRSSPAAPLPNTLYVLSPIEFREEAEVRQAIKDECALPELAEKYMKRRAVPLGYNVVPVQRYDNRGTVLRVSLKDVVGHGGGMFTGSKFVTGHVDLLKDGQVVASSELERITSSGIFSGACRIFESLIKSVSYQTVVWAVDQVGPPKVTLAKAPAVSVGSSEGAQAEAPAPVKQSPEK